MGEPVTVAVITASVRDVPIAPVSIDGVDFYPFTEENLPVRSRTMAPRMTAKIPKVWGWQMVPEHDVYVWLDATLTPKREDAISWLVGHLGVHDAVLFKHPTRSTVAEEAAFLRDNMLESNRLRRKYAGEYLDEQLKAVSGVRDDALYACGVFAYRATEAMQRVMATWWEHITRYHVNDQLSMPYALKVHGASVARIDEDVYFNGYFRWRPKGD